MDVYIHGRWLCVCFVFKYPDIFTNPTVRWLFSISVVKLPWALKCCGLSHSYSGGKAGYSLRMSADLKPKGSRAGSRVKLQLSWYHLNSHGQR